MLMIALKSLLTLAALGLLMVVFTLWGSALEHSDSTPQWVKSYVLPVLYYGLNILALYLIWFTTLK